MRGCYSVWASSERNSETRVITVIQAPVRRNLISSSPWLIVYYASIAVLALEAGGLVNVASAD